MFYMHPIQFTEYHPVVACQPRADLIEEKRTLNDKKQNSKNLVHGKIASMTDLYQAPLVKDKEFLAFC